MHYMSKYAFEKDAIICKFNTRKYAKNMQKYAKICSDHIDISPMHSYAFICTNI